ncbi:MAG: type II toxin-antitoxin system RelE/ParE family toxin [Deferribacteraceae bacterium]|jgi:addiction module RelE/StbE family toxin|nr:type II toxin-antitoxin system RelE/ParE family toxin [Deferribacteraceae bacterium]
MISWHQEALDDLSAIIDYISDDNPAAAQLLKDEILAKINNLLRFPYIYKPGRVEGTREMVVTTNYIVVYTENNGTITILRVLHTARLWP